MSTTQPVTERALLYIHPGEDITDSLSRAGIKWRRLLDSISQQPGFVAGYWGRRKEDETIAEHIVDWESLTQHEALNNNPIIINPIIEDMNPIMRPESTFYHIKYTTPKTSRSINLASFFPSIQATTEMKMCALSLGAAETTLELVVSKFLEEELNSAEGFKGGGYGWTLEGMKMEGVARPGGKERVLCLTSTWTSIAALQSFKSAGGAEKWERAVEGLVSQSQSDILELRRQ